MRRGDFLENPALGAIHSGIANRLRGGAESLKGSHRIRVRADFFKNLRASLFNKGPSNDLISAGSVSLNSTFNLFCKKNVVKL